VKDVEIGPEVLFRQAELVVSEGGQFTLDVSNASRADDVTLVIDVYQLDNAVHPQGHVGWWQFSLITSKNDVVEGRLLMSDSGGITVEVSGHEETGHWINSIPVAAKAWVVTAVIRTRVTNAILHLHRLPAFHDRPQVTDFRNSSDRYWQASRFAVGNQIVSNDATVRIVSRNIFGRDAVGNLCFEVHQLLRQNHIDARLYAEHYDLSSSDVIQPIERLRTDLRSEDRILFFFSTADPLLPSILELECTAKVAYYHGVTRPEAVRVFDPELAAASATGLEQTPLLQRFDRLAANSQASAAELLFRFDPDTRWRIADIQIIGPKVFSVAPIAAEGSPSRLPDLRLLTVGRVKAHKKIEDVLELFAEVLKLVPTAELAIVGRGEDKAYRDYLKWTERERLHLPEDKVHWRSDVGSNELIEQYCWASAYISMSEDEGFGLPILEAMMHGVPVVAYDIPAIKEVLGDAGLRFSAKDFPHLARRMIELLFSEPSRSEIRERGLKRAQELRAGMDGRDFLSFLFP
jgi:glycosyltransferase involved in cell wall biosynthesis